jgi:hypothetical protein
MVFRVYVNGQFARCSANLEILNPKVVHGRLCHKFYHISGLSVVPVQYDFFICIEQSDSTLQSIKSHLTPLLNIATFGQ